MLNITRDTTTDIYFTGSEQALLTDPYWLIIFTNGANEVKAVFTDTSVSKNRYNKVAVNANIFSNFDNGLWRYDIYEQASSSGTSTSGKNKVESGFMYLHDDAFNPTEYEGQDNTVVTYGK